MVVVACSSATSPILGDLFGDSIIRVTEPAVPDVNASRPKYAASINLVPYRDARNTESPNKIGISTQRVIGMSGTVLMVEPEVAVIVTNSLRKRLDVAGYMITGAGALYELGGVVKELNYDVKTRDEINIVVASTLKENATGKVVWSGVVVEKSDRFAGVSGNTKNDIASYLRAKVGVVADKTVESLNANLMASRPDLFNLTPGTMPIAGVTVLQAPAVPAAAGGEATAVTPAKAQLAVGYGVLLITSNPPRAKIYIEDVYYGLAPLRLELAPGVYKVRAAMSMRKENTEKISVRKGATTEIEMVLKR